MVTSSSAVQESVQGTSSTQEAPAYVIKGRTMSLEEWDLTVQVERPVDFASLIQHGCDIVDYYEAQDLGSYINMLNGPTYESLVKHLWVRASVYDKKASKLEEDQKFLIDPSLEGKSRQEISLEPFVDTEIRSSIMGGHQKGTSRMGLITTKRVPGMKWSMRPCSAPRRKDSTTVYQWKRR